MKKQLFLTSIIILFFQAVSAKQWILFHAEEGIIGHAFATFMQEDETGKLKTVGTFGMNTMGFEDLNHDIGYTFYLEVGPKQWKACHNTLLEWSKKQAWIPVLQDCVAFMKALIDNIELVSKPGALYIMPADYIEQLKRLNPKVNSDSKISLFKAAISLVNVTLLPYQDSRGKFGYKDKNGEIIISPQYSNASTFSEGLAAVYINGKCGFIDDKGTFIIKPLFDGCRGDFSEGVCSVILNDKWGVISRTGKVIVPFKYPYLTAFRNGFAIFSSDFGKDNNAYDHYGFINKQGKEIIPAKYTSAFTFSEGIAVVELRKTIGNDIIRQMAFIDTLGRMITDFKYCQAGYFTDGIAPAAIGQNYNKRFGFTSYKVGYIDKTGKQVIPFQWDDGYDFSEGLAPVRQGDNPNLALNAPGRYGKWGFIDKSGSLKIPLTYDDVWSFCNGIAAVKLNNKWGFIDYEGNVIVEPVYDEIMPLNLTYGIGLTKQFCKNGLLTATINGAIYYLDKTGKMLFIQHQ